MPFTKPSLPVPMGLALLAAVALPAQDPLPQGLPPAAREQVQDGLFISRYANGQVRERGPVDAGGRRDGDWVARHPNGRTAASGRFAAGVPDGAWQQCDQFGRPMQGLYFERGALRQQYPATLPLVPLSPDDLRLALDGERTLGGVLDACRPAPDAAALPRLLAELAPFAELAAAVVEVEAERAAVPAARRGWLRLLAQLPLPADLPVRPLLRWQWDADGGAAARAVLARWSQQFAAEWQQLIADGNADPNRFVRLQVLGAKASGALPALQQILAAQPHASWCIAGILGGMPAGLRPRLQELLDGDEPELRLRALAVLHAHRDAVAPPAAVLMRRLDDAEAASAQLAASLLAARLQLGSSAFDAWLERLAAHRSPLVRAAAANRLVQLGRTAAALPLLRELVRTPQLEAFAEAAMELVRHSDRRAADRELLLAAAQGGERFELYRAIVAIADDDPRAADLLVERWLSPRPYGVDLGRLPQGLRARAREQLRAGLASDAADVRGAAVAGLWVLADDAAELRQLAQRALADPDDAVRRRLLVCLRGRPMVALDRDTLVALLRDEATRGAALEQLAQQPLPDGFDPRQLPLPGAFGNGVPASVLATWAEGDADRIAVLVDFALAPGSPWQAVPALQLLQADLRPFADRIRDALLAEVADPALLPAAPGAPLAHGGWLLQQLPPEMARRTWVRRVLVGMSRPPRVRDGICVPTPRGPAQPWLDRPLAAADVPCIVDALGDPDPTLVAAAVRLLAHCGALAAGSTDALLATLPKLPVEALQYVPATVLAIAPQRATAVVAPLLAHADERVRQLALYPAFDAGVAEPAAASLPVDAAFARQLVAALAAAGDGAHSTWFAWLADGGRSALPEAAAALRQRPLHAGIARLLAGLGPAAAVARDELLAAVAAGNREALSAAGRALPADASLRELLLDRFRSDPSQAAVAAWLLVEVFAGDAAVARALRTAIESGSEPQAAAAIQALVHGRRSDADTVAALLAAVRRSPAFGYPGVAPLGDEVVLALLPQLGEAARERLLAHHLQLLAVSRDPAPLHPELLQATAALVPQARDRFALLVGLTLLAPEHPLVAGLDRFAQRSWNRFASRSLVSQSTLGSRVRHLVLLDAAQEPYENLRAALRADPARALAAILPYLDSMTPRHRQLALALLAELGDAAQAAFGAAVAALADADPQVRAAAVLGVAAIRPDDAAATAALLAADADLPAHRRPWVPALQRLPLPIATALLEQAPIDLDAAPYLLPAVLAVLGPDDARLQRLRQALREPWIDEPMLAAVAACGERGAELLPELRALLQDGWRREQAIGLLAGLGPAAALAADDLRALLPIPACRFAVREALRRIGGGR